MPIANTQELFIHELSEIYDAEHRFIEGQQEMVENATDESLRSAIQEHLDQTREHAANVEQVFRDLGSEPRRETNEVAQGLVSEAQEGIQQAQSAPLRDCAIVSAVIKVEHFEMGSYRSLVTGAQLMGQSDAAQLLKQNMDQEEQTAKLAESTSGQLLSNAMKEEGQEPEEGLLQKARDMLGGQ